MIRRFSLSQSHIAHGRPENSFQLGFGIIRHVVFYHNGIVIVPKDAIAEVVARVEEKNSGENLFRNAVKDGMAPSEAFAKYGVL